MRLYCFVCFVGAAYIFAVMEQMMWRRDGRPKGPNYGPEE